MADKPTDDDYRRMSRELAIRHASRMADSRGDSIPADKPGADSDGIIDSRSDALRSQVELSGEQTKGPSDMAGAEFKPGDGVAKRYTIKALIAQGGMGAVYRADDNNTGEVVALKTIRPDLVSSPQAVERFLSEGKVTRRLAHPGIARVFDIDQAEGRWFIAMEFVRGQTLRDWMRSKEAKGVRISVKDALWAARKIVDVLIYLHGQGIIHRDMKPENVIVGKASDGSGNFLKIIDFGLARSLTGNNPQLTATGAVIGTFNYMSPEQRAGKPLDQRSDIYSAAVIVYELLTGVAYDGNWEETSLIPPELSAALKNCLSKFPEQRPQSATELLELLKEVVHTGSRQDSPRTLPVACGTSSPDKPWWWKWVYGDTNFGQFMASLGEGEYITQAHINAANPLLIKLLHHHGVLANQIVYRLDTKRLERLRDELHSSTAVSVDNKTNLLPLVEDLMRQLGKDWFITQSQIDGAAATLTRILRTEGILGNEQFFLIDNARLKAVHRNIQLEGLNATTISIAYLDDWFLNREVPPEFDHRNDADKLTKTPFNANAIAAEDAKPIFAGIALVGALAVGYFIAVWCGFAFGSEDAGSIIALSPFLLMFCGSLFLMASKDNAGAGCLGVVISFLLMGLVFGILRICGLVVVH